VNLKQFKNRFSEIKGKSFKTVRAGDDGGAGRTLEHLLGLKESNIALPDLGKIELKTHRSDSNTPITLFTLDRDSWVMDQKAAVVKYGRFDEYGVKRLNPGKISVDGNSTGLYLAVNKNVAYIGHRNGDILISWELDDIRERFEDKLPAIILVDASVKGTKPEQFIYNMATLLQSPSKNSFKTHLRHGNIFVETRLGLKKGVIRNHGTAFRAYERNLKNLFDKQVTI